MTQDERGSPDSDVQRNAQVDAELDAELRRLPLAVAPSRDLWPDIAARIATQDSPTQPARRTRGWTWQVAAAVVLVAGSSLLTATLLDRRAAPGQSAATVTPHVSNMETGAAIVMPAAFGPAGKLDPEYLAARQQLTQLLEQRIAELPASARAKLEFNLGEMRRAADEINAALAEQPGDPLLEELLLKTYQDELAVLSNVSELTNSLERTPAPTAAKRMQL